MESQYMINQSIYQNRFIDFDQVRSINIQYSSTDISGVVVDRSNQDLLSTSISGQLVEDHQGPGPVQ